MLDATKRAAESIAATTEEWCRRAYNCGPGYRLWRSEMRSELDASGYRLVHDYQVLGPYEDAPGSGMIFGPWPEGLAT